MIKNTELPQGHYSVPEHELFLFECFHRVKDTEDSLWKFLLYQQEKGNLEKYRKNESEEKSQ